MHSVARSAVAPLYLVACLTLGGSAQGIWANAILQIAGLGILVWVASTKAGEPLPKSARTLLLIAIAAVCVVGLQDIPLPTSLWEHSRRARILDDYRQLGRPLSFMPISLTPYASLSALLCLIPPLAMFCAVLRLDAHRRTWLAGALLIGTITGSALAGLQVASPGETSPWYLYRETNRGLGVGFFANANHMASLQIISLPFVAALAATTRRGDIQRDSVSLVILAAALLLIVVGIGLNGSLAGYALLVPVTAASALIVLPRGNKYRAWLAAGAAISVVAAVAGLATSSVGATKLGQGASASLQSRQEILRTTATAIGDFMPWGSGLGSFVPVYRLYESPDSVTLEYVVHAHNDYAELTLELGVWGLLLIFVFLAWWASAVRGAWFEAENDPFARAASIASTAVLLHSLVDFPLRTAAISACFAMCLAFLGDRRTPPRSDVDDLRPTRHLVIA